MLFVIFIFILFFLFCFFLCLFYYFFCMKNVRTKKYFIIYSGFIGWYAIWDNSQSRRGSKIGGIIFGWDKCISSTFERLFSPGKNPETFDFIIIREYTSESFKIFFFSFSHFFFLFTFSIIIFFQYFCIFFSFFL